MKHYAYEGKEKAYKLTSMDVKYHEASRNKGEGSFNLTEKLDTWSDPAKQPDKTTFWKEMFKTSSVGKASTFTFSSKGHDYLPKFFDIQSKHGTYMRITDFTPGARSRVSLFCIFHPMTKEMKPNWISSFQIADR